MAASIPCAAAGTGQARPSKESRLRTAPRFPRLVGVDLRPVADGSTLVVTPAGSIFQVMARVDQIWTALTLCDGSHSVPEVIAAAGLPAAFVEVIEQLGASRCLVEGPARQGERDWARFAVEPVTPDAMARTRFLLLGDEDLLGIIRGYDLLPATTSVQIIGSLDRFPAATHGNPADAVVVALCGHLETTVVEELDDRCAAEGFRWVQFHLAEGRGWFGPAIEPGSNSYRDVLLRRRCAAVDAEVFDALLGPIWSGTGYRPPRSELIWMLSVLAVELERWLAGAPSALLGNEIEADPVSLTTTLHPVLPWPGSTPAAGYRNPLRSGLDLLVDERAGIITSVRRFEPGPPIPRDLTVFVATVGDTSRVVPWATNLVGGSAQLAGIQLEGIQPQVRQAAIGEAIERYCGNWIRPERLVQASYDELCRRGEHALDPTAMVLYSDRQYRAAGFPFVPFRRDLPVRWIPGENLSRGVPAWVPASFAYVSWHIGEFAPEPPVNYPLYSGIACGSSWEMALCSALEELIERDSTMIWWANLPVLPALVPHSAAHWEQDGGSADLRAWLIHLDNLFGVPVLAGLVENTDKQLLTAGFAARSDPVSAARKAWGEALTAQVNSMDLLQPDGLFREAVRLGQKSGVFLKPWRADRAYLDSFRPDFHDVGDLECQPQIYLDPRAIAQVRPALDVPRVRDWGTLPHLAARSSEVYRGLLEEAGFEVFVVDLTTPDVALTGLTVLRVVVPGLVPNFPAAFPFLGGRRLQDAGVWLGWREQPLDEADLNIYPLPHA